jgi:hypothetical protein
LLSTVLLLAVAGPLAAQGGWTVDHQPPTCLSSLCGKVVISATVAGEPAPDTVRVYFRAGAEGAEYYLDMNLVGDVYEAVLPAPLRDTPSVSYRIVLEGGGATQSTDPVVVPVTADCQLPQLNPAQATVALNTVIGLTEAGQTGSPAGFSCAGLTKVIGVDETMAPNNACEEVRLAKTDPCFAPPPKSDQDLIGLAALGAGLVAGAVIIDDNDDGGPVSPSRP